MLLILSTFFVLFVGSLDPDEPFDIRMGSIKGSKYVEIDKFSYPPPPVSQYCTMVKHESDQFTFDTSSQTMSQWIRKCESGCLGEKYRAGELITTSHNLKYGFYSFFLKAPTLDSISGLWIEFGLSNFGAFRAVVYGIVGKWPKKGYTGTTTGGIQSKTEYPDLPEDSRSGIHEYGILWNKDKILWTFDGKPIRSYNDTQKIPKDGNLGMYIDFYPHCGHIMDEWLGPFNDTMLPVALEVSRLRYYPGATKIIPY